MVPTMTQLSTFTEHALLSHQLTKISYLCTDSIESLTFNFGNNLVSPTPGTYWNEPNISLDLPDHLLNCRKIEFLTYRKDEEYWLYSIKMIDNSYKSILHL